MDTTEQTQMTPKELETLLASPECAALVVALADAVRAILARKSAQSALTSETDEAPPKEKARSSARKPSRK